MPRDRKKATRPATLLGDVVLDQLRVEAHSERHQVDVDAPRHLSSMDSAQSRRAMAQGVAHN